MKTVNVNTYHLPCVPMNTVWIGYVNQDFPGPVSCVTCGEDIRHGRFYTDDGWVEDITGQVTIEEFIEEAKYNVLRKILSDIYFDLQHQAEYTGRGDRKQGQKEMQKVRIFEHLAKALEEMFFPRS